MQVYVKIGSGKVVTLSVVLSDKTEDVKRKVRRRVNPTTQVVSGPELNHVRRPACPALPSLPCTTKVFAKAGIPPDLQWLMYAGKPLVDNHLLG